MNALTIVGLVLFGLTSGLMIWSDSKLWVRCRKCRGFTAEREIGPLTIYECPQCGDKTLKEE